MTELRVQSFRGEITETIHDVAVAVVNMDGDLVASSGDPGVVTPMRSAAKPFQALPLVEDGVADRFGLGSQELALACSSHNSELHQVDIVREWMQRQALTEDQLVCGPHRPLAKDLGYRRHDGTWDHVDLAEPSRVASNCSGKHTGMLTLAAFHGWQQEGYEAETHQVQARCRATLVAWCGVPEHALGVSVDGCGVVTWALPLRAMAVGFAGITRRSGAMREIVSAMMAHPGLVAGKRRLCTALMNAYPGEVLAKVGAGGVYGAAVMERGIGIAIKAMDGDSWAAGVALLHVLEGLGIEPLPSAVLFDFARPVILNTNFVPVGHYEPTGSLSFNTSKVG